MAEQDQLLTEQAAAYLNLKPETLHRWRQLTKGPKYFKLEGTIRYAKSALDAYLEQCEQTSTR